MIENSPGGGGLTGSLRVSQAAADSHIFVLASIGTHAIGYSMHSKPMYHPANDFQPVAFVADAPLMLMTKKDLPPNNQGQYPVLTNSVAIEGSFSRLTLQPATGDEVIVDSHARGSLWLPKVNSQEREVMSTLLARQTTLSAATVIFLA